MKRVPWAAAGLVLLLAALVLPAAQPDRKRIEAEEANLRALTERIERERRQVQSDAVEMERLNRALHDAERSVSRANGDLSALRAQRTLRSESRQRLVAERSQRQGEREAAERDLASQLRAAYFMGRSEPLKLLLNQRNPAEFGRNLTYYGYLGRLRASQIGVIKGNIARIDELTVQIDAEDAELALLESQQKGRVAELESARRQRGRVLASLQQESQGRVATLDRLQKQREQLEQVLKKLSRAAESLPFDPDSPFAQLRGKLSWPVAGRIVANYGATIAGGLRSNGIDIDADRGAEVRAVHEGRVIHSDWLPGRGNLIILDHGNGYWSLYGHLDDELFARVGTRVTAGEKIATVSDTGGRKKPGLYFEIRRATRPNAAPVPVDPRGWFRTSTPPAG